MELHLGVVRLQSPLYEVSYTGTWLVKTRIGSLAYHSTMPMPQDRKRRRSWIGSKKKLMFYSRSRF